MKAVKSLILVAMENENTLLARMVEGDHRSFSLLFTKYYKDLTLYAASILCDRSVCEDIVQNVFVKLWADRETLRVESSLKGYLIRAVRNGCLDELRHRQVLNEHHEWVILSHKVPENEFDSYILYSDLNTHIEKALTQLPEPLREVFTLSRFKGLKHREISEKLEISVRTVEDRLSKSLKILRQLLKEFIALFLLFNVANSI